MDPYYRNNAFSTQISLELLQVADAVIEASTGIQNPLESALQCWEHVYKTLSVKNFHGVLAALHKKCPLAMLFRGKMGLSGLEKPSK
jgi:hypothetical protein